MGTFFPELTIANTRACARPADVIGADAPMAAFC